MAGVRVAVTGASGFVGGHVARDLAARGHTVLALGRRAPGVTTAGLPGYTQWDVTREPPAMPAVDAVVHCAAHVADWGDEARFRTVNVEGTRRVLAAFPGARVVHVSTTSVYSDDLETVRLRESAPTGDCPHSAYARTKAEAERVVMTESPGAVILRPHIVYGSGDTTLVPRLLAARRLGWLLVPGTGDTHVSVTAVGNLAIAVAAALERPLVSGAFNIADADSISMDALLRLVLARAGVHARVAWFPAPVGWALAWVLETVWRAARLRGAPMLTRYAVGHLTREHTVDISQAREQLGYVPRWRIHDSWG